jgi:hypothetical protein
MGAADVGVVTLEACQHRDGRRENDGVVRGRRYGMVGRGRG